MEEQPTYELPLTVQDIQTIIPHRYPFLFIDKIVEFEDGQRMVGIKNVTANEPFFQGHFPGRPVLPGVIILEALAQLGAAFAKVSSGGIPRDKLIVFAGADEVRFRRLVVPGDVLRLEVVHIRHRPNHWKIRGTAHVEGELAVDAVLAAAIVG